MLPVLDVRGGVKSPLSCFIIKPAFFFLFVLLSCRKEQSDSDHALLELSSYSIVFDYEGGVRETTIYAQDECTLEYVPEWLDATVSRGNIIRVTAGTNETSSVLNGRIRISAGGQRVSLSVKQNAKPVLSFLSDDVCALSGHECTVSVEFNANVPWNVKVSSDGWLSLAKHTYDNPMVTIVGPDQTHRRLMFHVTENETEEERSGCVILECRRYAVADTLYVCQSPSYEQGNEPENEPGQSDDLDDPSEVYRDGDVITLMKAVKGNVNLVVMGDGFTAKHLSKEGYYEQTMKLAVQHFFELEPYATYRDYFNVYMVVAESQTEEMGTGGMYGQYGSGTKFESRFGSGTSISCNQNTVFEYVSKITAIGKDIPVLCILVLNEDRYAGTCYMYQDGNSIALCPMSTLGEQYGFPALIHHEAGGHGFGFFADEYVYYNRQMPQTRIDNIRQWQELGYQMNLDFTDDPSVVHWSSFIGLAGYENVGIYEGGQEYQYGVWRSEENSCMNDNIPYYSAQCRWLIYERIMKLSGKDCSRDAFLENDHIPENRGYGSFCKSTVFVPTEPPKLMGKAPR